MQKLKYKSITKKLFLLGVVATLLISCGKRSNSSGSENRTLSALITSQAINIRCSQDSSDRRCTRIVSAQVLSAYDFFSPFCYQRYVRCVNGGI